MTWYDLLSSLGGLISLVLGTSLITVFELIYFGCYRFCQYLREDFGPERDDLRIILRREMKKTIPTYGAIERSLNDEYHRRETNFQ